MTSTPVHPFYDSCPAPPPIPLLSTPTPAIYSNHRVSLVANEELRLSRPKSTTSAPSKSRGSTPLPQSRTGSKNPRHSPPLRTPPHARHPSEPQANSREATPVEYDGAASTPSRVSPSELTELSEDSEDSDASTQILIPKPPGSPGRPGSGGYNLAVAMKWSPSAFKKLKVATIPSCYGSH